MIKKSTKTLKSILSDAVVVVGGGSGADGVNKQTTRCSGLHSVWLDCDGLVFANVFFSWEVLENIAIVVVGVVIVNGALFAGVNSLETRVLAVLFLFIVVVVVVVIVVVRRFVCSINFNKIQWQCLP